MLGPQGHEPVFLLTIATLHRKRSMSGCHHAGLESPLWSVSAVSWTSFGQGWQASKGMGLQLQTLMSQGHLQTQESQEPP